MAAAPKTANSLDKLQAKQVEAISPAHALGLKILGYKGFDYVMGTVIVFNMFVMVVETDRSADETIVTDEGHWTAVVGWAILTLFVLELVLRIFVQRSGFFKDPMNVFDMGVVVIDSLFSVLGLVLGNFFPVSILRVCRLAKLARVSKVLRVFPELRIMMAGLLGSMSALWWGTVLLTIFLLVWSIVAVQFIQPLNKDMDHGDCERCYRAFDTVLASMLTISQTSVLGDSWGTISIPIIEAHPFTVPFFAGVFLSVGLGILNLILGVVCNVFTLAHDNICKEIEDEKIMIRMESKNHLFSICQEMDVDDSGDLTEPELRRGFRENDAFRETLGAMDVSEEDLEILWSILDSDKSGKISYSEFASQVYTMTSSDNQFMLAYIRFYVTQIRDTIVDNIKQAEKREDIEMEKIEATEVKILEIMESMEPGSAKTGPTGETFSLTQQENRQSCTNSSTSQDQPSMGVKRQDEQSNGAKDSTSQDRPSRSNGNTASAEALSTQTTSMRSASNEAPQAQMQAELKDIASSLQFSLDQQISTISLMLQDLAPSRRQADPELLVVPVNNTARSICGLWGSPDERKVPEEQKALTPSTNLSGQDALPTGSSDLQIRPGRLS